eukprot:6180132-Pleurochrysis_carterae.AAC.1
MLKDRNPRSVMLFQTLSVACLLCAVRAQPQGCQDTTAENYVANLDSFTPACVYPPDIYCSDPTASNYDSSLTANPTDTAVNGNWSCVYDVYGCSHTNATNYQSFVTISVSTMCQFAGCNDTEAINFDSKVAPPENLLSCGTRMVALFAMCLARCLHLKETSLRLGFNLCCFCCVRRQHTMTERASTTALAAWCAVRMLVTMSLRLNSILPQRMEATARCSSERQKLVHFTAAEEKSIWPGN